MLAGCPASVSGRARPASHPGAGRERERSDEPDQCERAGAGAKEHHETEQHCEGAVHHQQPLVVDLLAQTNRADDLRDAVEQRPNADDRQQHECREAGPEERH